MNATKTRLKQKVADEIVELGDVNTKIFGLAEEVLTSIVQDDRNPFYEEITFFRCRCAWDDATIERQINRMRAVVRHQSIAGTTAARADAVAERKRSQQILETEGLKIDEQIQALTAQKNTLENNARRAEKQCEDIAYSLSELRQLLPPHVANDYERSRQAIANEFVELGSLSVEIPFRETLLGPVPDELNAYQRFCESIQRSYPECVGRNAHKPGIFQLMEPVWSDRKKVLAKELAEMKSRHAELSAARDKAMAEADNLLNFYAR